MVTRFFTDLGILKFIVYMFQIQYFADMSVTDGLGSSTVGVTSPTVGHVYPTVGGKTPTVGLFLRLSE
jgi:hypothetical protein